MKKYAIFDLDGCLSDDRWRRDQIKNSYDSYHSSLLGDAPMNVNVLVDAFDEGLIPVIVTARPDKYRSETVAWLKKFIPDRVLENVYAIYMRPEKNKMSSPDLKEYLVIKSNIGFDNIKVVYDDRDDVLEMYQRHNICAEKLTVGSTEDPVTEILQEGAKTFRERSAVYGKNYIAFGAIAKALWPDGVSLKTEDDFIRHGILIQCLNKLTRYVNSPAGHKDSAHDLMVYGALLEAVTK